MQTIIGKAGGKVTIHDNGQVELGGNGTLSNQGVRPKGLTRKKIAKVKRGTSKIFGEWRVTHVYMWYTREIIFEYIGKVDLAIPMKIRVERTPFCKK